ncbi:MAG: alkaline phosphatase family protein, partial [Chloroflexi bacterium]|nr:alkaline phosphatase family protein [Chloroflexota bacterium]
ADAVRVAYAQGEDDERMEPIVRVDGTGQPVGRIQDGDYVIFYDLRGEREVELTEVFVDPGFDHFSRPAMTVRFATLIRYHPHLEELGVRVAFPPEEGIADTLSEVVSRAGRRQIKIGESEKAIHITFFLNGKRRDPLPGEDRVVIESDHVRDYTTVPAMKAREVADAVIQALGDPGYDLVVANLANVDVVGHSENDVAIKQAVSVVDAQVGRILDAAQAAGATALVTADHGTVESWLYPDGVIDTGHTVSPVPFVLVAPVLDSATLCSDGSLIDVAPTVLQLLGVPQPALMTGQSLIAGPVPGERRRVLLLVLDGWGHNDAEYGNLIRAADTPVMDRLQREHPSTILAAAGEAVGLPAGTVGNSEVGHLHLGAGRPIYSDRVRVNRAIADSSYDENPAFLWAVRGARDAGTRLHLLGIVSFYSSHGDVAHLEALMDLAHREGVPEVYIHSMLGRRGERPESGALYIARIEDRAQTLGQQVVGVIGRFWALDREENWDRIEKTYRWLVDGLGTAVYPPDNG